jgi:TPR repeat protein
MPRPRLLLLPVLCLLVAGASCRSGGDSAGPEVEKACAAGDRGACGKAAAVWEDRCARRDAAACASLAALHLRGGTGTGAIDKVKAVVAYERGCDAGDAGACNRAAAAWGSKDRSKTDRLRQQACALGSGDGCLNAAGLLRERGDAEAGRADALLTRAKEIFGKACAAGDPDGCYGMAGAVRRDDEEQAQRYFREAAKIWQPRCDAGDLPACHRLGIAYGEESGVPFDENRARQLLDGACAKGHLPSCTELAHMFRATDAKDDDPRAAELFARSCQAGLEDRLPCREAAFMFAEGEGVAADKRRALPLLENGCNLGDEWCCFKLGSLLVDGDGVPADPRKGAELLQAASGLEFRVVEVKRGTKMVDPGLTAFGIPETSLTPTSAAKGEELILVALEARRTTDTARLPVRKMYLLDAAGKRYENHAPGDSAFGDRPLERREFMFRVPAGMQPVKVKFELGGITLTLPEPKKS